MRSKAVDLGRQGGAAFWLAGFLFGAPSDTYGCPAGDTLTKRATGRERSRSEPRVGLAAADHARLSLTARPATNRGMPWDHDHVEAMQDRLARMAVPHPFLHNLHPPWK